MPFDEKGGRYSPPERALTQKKKKNRLKWGNRSLSFSVSWNTPRREDLFFGREKRPGGQKTRGGEKGCQGKVINAPLRFRFRKRGKTLKTEAKRTGKGFHFSPTFTECFWGKGRFPEEEKPPPRGRGREEGPWRSASRDPEGREVLARSGKTNVKGEGEERGVFAITVSTKGNGSRERLVFSRKKKKSQKTWGRGFFKPRNWGVAAKTRFGTSEKKKNFTIKTRRGFPRFT